MTTATNPVPGPAFIYGAMALGFVLSPILIPAAGGIVAAHLISAKLKRRFA